RVDDALSGQVAVDTVGGVVAVTDLQLGDVVGDHVTLGTGVLGDPASGLRQSVTDDRHTGLLVVLQTQVTQGGGGVHQGSTATGDDSLLDGRTGRRDGVLQAVLLLLELDLGGGTDPQDGHASGELGRTLLQLLPAPVAFAGLALVTDRTDASRAPGLLTGTIHDGGGVLGDGDTTRAAQDLDLGVVQGQTNLFGDDLTTGQNGDVLEHGLATLTETGCLDGSGVERATDLVEHQGTQSVALDVLGDDQQRLLALQDLLQQGEQLVEVADLALVDQDQRILQHRFLTVSVGDEVGRDVPLVELHPLGEVEVEPERWGLLDGDDTVLADLVEGLGYELTDLVVLRGVGRHVGDVLALRDRRRTLDQGLGHLLGSCRDAPLQGHRRGTGGDAAQPIPNERLGEHGSCGGPITCGVVGLGGHLLDQLGTQVLIGVVQLDLTGDGHTVVRDGGGTELLVDDDV